jgi:large subunit ribosomal protein L32e
MIMAEKKDKPKFSVLNLGFFKRVKDRWRKPRGTHNKKRMKFAWTGALPGIGYKNPEALRGLLPNGTKEVLVHNVQELEGLSGVTVRIASAVGARKRKLIEEKAKSMDLRVANVRGRKKKFEPRKKKKPKK